MPARMHGVGLLAGPRLASGLCDGQAVHVGANADGGTRAVTESCNKSAADVVADPEAQASENFVEVFDGARKIKAHFGPAVELAAPFNDLVD